MIQTILVTGGAGFIGRNLCQNLLDEGNYVICIDNHCSSSASNILGLQSNPRFIYRCMDINLLKPEHLTSTIHYIYHLACPASPSKYQRDPLVTLNTCYIGTLNILEIARVTGAKILFSSTSEIYGNPTESPQKESYYGNVNTVGNRSCYDEGKRVAETLVRCYCTKWKMEHIIVRIFNTYGPYMAIDDGRVVTNFIRQTLKNIPITVYGDGLQTRSLCYIDDMIAGLKLAMAGTHQGPVNIGNPDCEITVKDLADIIVKLVEAHDKPTDIHHLARDKDDPVHRKPDISLAQSHFEWTPKISLEEGLTKTIKYFAEII